MRLVLKILMYILLTLLPLVLGITATQFDKPMIGWISMIIIPIFALCIYFKFSDELYINFFDHTTSRGEKRNGRGIKEYYDKI